MTLSDFHTVTHGKWILAGEHAVIRGFGALVFPVLNHRFELSYYATNQNLVICTQDQCGHIPESLFTRILRHGFKLLNNSNQLLPKGTFEINNSIPTGAGIGASAALSVAVTRWFIHQKLLDQNQWYHFAKSLEDLFHGKSSGLDVAGVAHEKAIYFQKHSISTLHQAWHPHWYLSQSGKKGITSACVGKVSTLWEKDPVKGAKIDEQMFEAVRLARKALEHDVESSFENLAHAITQAEQCFNEWGLITPEMANQARRLKQAGAAAVKPTGSGDGGYLISLWQHKPNIKDIELMAI